MGSNLSPEEVKDKYIVAMGNELGPLYHYLSNECSILHLDWLEFKEVFGTSEERIRLLNDSAPSFFGRLQSILWEMVLLRIARFMDPASSWGKGKENASLSALERHIDLKIRAQFAGSVMNARSTCQFALDWRNRRIAHRDLALALKVANPLASASRLNVDHALEAIGSALNIVESHYCDGGSVAYDFLIPSVRGAKALLHVVRDGLEAGEEADRKLKAGEIGYEERRHMRRPI